MKTRLFILSGLILFVIPLWLQLRKGFTAAQLQLTSTPAFSLYLPLIQKPEITWSQTSQGMETADFFTFAVSPAYSIDKTLFAGTYMFTGGGTGGAIYKSIDGGVSWQLVNDGLAGEAITTLAISPNYFTDRTLFVGTLGSCSSGSIHKSTDGGISWESSGTFSQNAEDIAISPSYATDFTVFATVGYGVYKTINGGATWIGVYTRPLSYGWATKLAISPAYSTDHIVFVKSGNYEVSKSTDGGAMWTQLPPLSGVVNAIAISPNYLIDQTLFATVSSANPYFLKIYKSIDSGLSWVQVSPNLPPALNKNSIQISSGYASDHTLYVIASSNYTTSIYLSTNNGNSWESTGSFDPNCSNGDARLSPDFITDQIVFAACKEGFFKSINKGMSWSRISQGATGLIVHKFALSPGYQTDNTIFAATACGGVYKSTNRGMSWISMSNGLAYGKGSCILSLAVSPNYLSDQTLFAGGSYEGIYKSTDGGNSWMRVDSYGSSPESLVRSIAISPNFQNDHTVFVGTLGGILRSNDNGTSWQKLDTGSFSMDNTHAIALSPNYSTDQTIFAGTDFTGDGLAKSTDGGDAWTLITENIVVYDLLWTPVTSTASTIYFGTCGGKGVCQTNNLGASWICSAVPGDSRSLAFSPNYVSNGIVFVGGDSGVYQSTDNGLSWKSINKGLGNLSVYALAVAPTNPPILFAGTPSGVWQIKVSP